MGQGTVLSRSPHVPLWTMQTLLHLEDRIPCSDTLEPPPGPELASHPTCRGHSVAQTGNEGHCFSVCRIFMFFTPLLTVRDFCPSYSQLFPTGDSRRMEIHSLNLTGWKLTLGHQALYGAVRVTQGQKTGGCSEIYPNSDIPPLSPPCHRRLMTRHMPSRM